MSLIYRRPWDSQPPDTLPASDLALALRVSHLSTGDFRFDAACGRAVSATLTSGELSSQITLAGRGVRTTGAISFNQTRTIIPNGDYTVLFVGDAKNDTTQACYAFTQLNGGSQIAVGLNFDDQFAANGTASGRLSITSLQSGVIRSHAYVAAAVGAAAATRVFLIRRRGTVVEMWIDGAKRAVTGGTGWSGAPAGATNAFYLAGRSDDGGKRFSGSSDSNTLVMTAVLQSAPSDALCAELSTLSGAWQLFEPRQILIPSVPAGIVTPTLLTASGQNITSTSFRPRVTFSRP